MCKDCRHAWLVSDVTSQGGGQPRILHLSLESSRTRTSSALLARQLLGIWPESQILEVAVKPPIAFPDVVVLPRRTFPLDLFVPARGTPGPATEATTPVAHAPVARALLADLRYQSTGARATLSRLLDNGPARVDVESRRNLTDFRPDVLYTPLGSVRMMAVALAVSRALRIPIMPHFLDNWALPMMETARGRRRLGRITKRAPIMATIGQQMADEYREVFGRECVPVGTSAQFVERPERPVADHPVIGYVGGLHLGRLEAIRRVVSSLSGTGWSLALHVPVDQRSAAAELAQASHTVRLGEALAPDAIEHGLAKMDALLFVEPGQGANEEFVRLSVSSKTPAYLAAGRPILTVGPAEQASIRLLHEYGMARALDPGDENSIGVGLRWCEDPAVASAAAVTPERRDQLAAILGTEATLARFQSAVENAIGIWNESRAEGSGG